MTPADVDVFSEDATASSSGFFGFWNSFDKEPAKCRSERTIKIQSRPEGRDMTYAGWTWKPIIYGLYRFQGIQDR